jgi:hypothetical protein
MLMNKRRLEEAVPRAGGFAPAEAAARAINAEPWEPLPGMVKLQCAWCHYLFAAPVGSEELRCPDCATFGTRTTGRSGSLTGKKEGTQSRTHPQCGG